MSPLRCVLITPARNEEAFIAKTIESMVSQTIRPIRWVIVNDGSTDRTGRSPAAMRPSMTGSKWSTCPERRDRSFAAKVHSFNAGYAKVKGLDYEIIGNLDADISFDIRPSRVRPAAAVPRDPRPGVAGTSLRRRRLQLGDR